MRNTTATLAAGILLSTLGLFGADSRLGTWKLNVAKSKSESTNPVKSQTDVREAVSDGSILTTRTAELRDGTVVNCTFTYKDGQEAKATGCPFDVITVKRVDANTTTFEVKKTGGKYHMTGRNRVSKNGKIRTQTSKGIDTDGKPISQTMVYEKQ
jgi:hypothetical protein